MIFNTTHGPVDLLNPRPEDVRADRLATPLSRICRYGGHVPRHYSVAEHSINVCKWAQVLADKHGIRDADSIERVRLAALLHDAHEVYVGDMTRPLKAALTASGSLEELDRVTALWDAAVCDLYEFDRDLDGYAWKIAAEADDQVIAAEIKKFFNVDVDGAMADVWICSEPLEDVGWYWLTCVGECCRRLRVSSDKVGVPAF